MEDLFPYFQSAWDAFLEIAPTLAKAIAILIIGFWGAKKINSIITKALHRSSLSAELTTFITSITGVALKICVLLAFAGTIGVNLASIAALLAAAGFAVGLALQGSLSNFAAGIIILVFKPYKVGDWIEVKEKFGMVESIQIFNTIMTTPGRKTLIIPNGQIIDDVVTNFSNKGCIRIELNVTMPYAESFPKVQGIIKKVLSETPKVLQNPVPEIGIETYDSHNLTIAVRPYVAPDDYWEVTFDAYERIKRAFNENKIQVAYSEGVELGSIGE